PSGSREELPRLDPGTARPVGRGHHPLALRLDLAEHQLLPSGEVAHRVALDVQALLGVPFRLADLAQRADLEPFAAERRPGAWHRGAPADAPVDDVTG